MEFQSLTLAGLASIGVVNVVLMFKPDIDSRIKFIIAFLTAFAVLFIPQEFGNMLLEKLKLALEVAFASSGTYKLFQVAGQRNINQ